MQKLSMLLGLYTLGYNAKPKKLPKFINCCNYCGIHWVIRRIEHEALIDLKFSDWKPP